jgi:hypothetical protein
MPVLRVAALFLLILVVVGLLFTRPAQADGSQVLLGFGAQMMRYADSVTHDAPRGLSVNGQRLSFAAGTTRDEVTRLLDEYARRCAEHGALGERGTLRQGDERHGFVACFDAGKKVAPEEAVLRVKRFLDSGDLSDVGRLRYVYAERGRNLTRFITFWTDGSLDIHALFPRTGDAPGRDVPGIERPEGARRLLTTWEAGEPRGMVVYAGGSLGVDELAARYRHALPTGGFVVLADMATKDGHAFELRRGGTRVSLSLTKGGLTVLVDEGATP